MIKYQNFYFCYLLTTSLFLKVNNTHTKFEVKRWSRSEAMNVLVDSLYIIETRRVSKTGVPIICPKLGSPE